MTTEDIIQLISWIVICISSGWVLRQMRNIGKTYEDIRKCKDGLCDLMEDLKEREMTLEKRLKFVQESAEKVRKMQNDYEDGLKKNRN